VIAATIIIYFNEILETIDIVAPAGFDDLTNLHYMNVCLVLSA